MFIGFSSSLPRTKKIATIVASSPKARTTSGKKIQACGFGQPAGVGDGVDADAQDHRADVLGGGRFEQVRATAGAVADVVADEVGDDARVAGVVLGDALLDLADEVRADVRGLGVDAAAELGEERDERGAEAEADDEERGLGDGDLADEGRVGGEDAPHAEERQRDDEEARDGPAAHRHLDRLDEAAARCRCRPNVGLDRDEHADDPRRHRARGADEEGEAGHDPDRQARRASGTSATSAVSTMPMTTPMTTAPTTARIPIVVYWRRMKRGRAFVDGAGDVLHRLGPGVARQDVPGEIDREQDGDDAGGQDDQLQRTGVHQDRGSSTLG